MIQIRAPFNIREKSLHAIFDDYKKRILWNFEFKNTKNLLEKITSKDFLIVMDIDGISYRSEDFAKILDQKIQNYKNIIFLIGGDVGLSNEIRNQANLKISFGKQTWPHQLCAVMLIEQIYRAQQIINNHPYHK